MLDLSTGREPDAIPGGREEGKRGSALATREEMAASVFLASPQSIPYLHNMYTEALPFALAQFPLPGAQSKERRYI